MEGCDFWWLFCGSAMGDPWNALKIASYTGLGAGNGKMVAPKLLLMRQTMGFENEEDATAGNNAMQKGENEVTKSGDGDSQRWKAAKGKIE